MFCARCGHEVGASDRTCPNCQLDLMNTSGALRMTRGVPHQVAVWTPQPTAERPNPKPVQLGRVSPPPQAPVEVPPTPVSPVPTVDPDAPTARPTPVRTEEQMDALIAHPSPATQQIWEAREEQQRRRNRMAIAALGLMLLAVLIPLAIAVERMLHPPPLVPPTPTPTVVKTGKPTPTVATTRPTTKNS